jgi:uncharacterized protein
MEDSVPAAPPPLGPVSLAERFEAIDVVRGLALFGIIASNMRAFNGPMAAYMDHSLMWTDLVSRVTQAFLDVLVSGKFITIFSFLFGIGFAIQMDRAEARGLGRRGFYLRRLTVLLLLGLIHGFLVWWGDILAPYALMGFCLYGFRKESPGTILIWAAALYSWPWIVNLTMLLAEMAGAKIPMPPPTTAAELARLIRVHASGGYLEILAERAKDMGFSAFGVFFFYPRLLGIFLAGLWVWRSGLVRSLASNAALLRRCQTWGLALGLPLNLAMMAIGEIFHPNPVAPSVSGFWYQMAGGLGMPLLSLFYVSTVARLFLDPEWRARLHGFAAIGRTALSNYLAQSVVCTLIFYGYGLGFYGQCPPLPGLALSILIYGLQVPLSVWWTRRYAFGPAEWVWRALTYGVRPAFSATR